MNASKFSEFTFSEASANGLQHNAMFAQVKMVGRIRNLFVSVFGVWIKLGKKLQDGHLKKLRELPEFLDHN